MDRLETSYAEQAEELKRMQNIAKDSGDTSKKLDIAQEELREYRQRHSVVEAKLADSLSANAKADEVICSLRETNENRCAELKQKQDDLKKLKRNAQP